MRKEDEKMLTEEMLKAANMSLLRGFDEKDPFSIDLKCNVCGAIKNLSLQQVKVATSVSCRACEGKELLIKNLEKKFGRNPYEFLSSYKTNKDPIKVRCKDCGYEFSIVPIQMLHTKNYPDGIHPCRRCTELRASNKALEEFNTEEIHHFGAVKHEPLKIDELKSMQMKNKIKFRCRHCGEIFEAQPLLLATTEEYYCPKCSPKYNPEELYNKSDIFSIKSASELKNRNYIKISSDFSEIINIVKRRKLNKTEL